MAKYNVGVPSEEEATELIDSKEVQVDVESNVGFFRAGYRYCLGIIAGHYLGGASAISLVDSVVHESLELGKDREPKPDPMAVFNRPECPFSYCDQAPPYEACKDRCHYKTT